MRCVYCSIPEGSWIYFKYLLKIIYPSFFQHHVASLRSDGPFASTPHSNSQNSYRSFIGSTPAEYMTYLLRAHSKEDAGCLPVIDLYG